MLQYNTSSICEMFQRAKQTKKKRDNWRSARRQHHAEEHACLFRVLVRKYYEEQIKENPAPPSYDIIGHGFLKLYG